MGTCTTISSTYSLWSRSASTSGSCISVCYCIVVLAFVIFIALYLHNEQNPDVRWYNYVQGWSFIVIAASSYEWLYSTSRKTQIIAAIAERASVENPYTWLTKRYSVIFFGALFVFWLLETRKKRFVKPTGALLSENA